jgi:hypothetical protein
MSAGRGFANSSSHAAPNEQVQYKFFWGSLVNIFIGVCQLSAVACMLVLCVALPSLLGCSVLVQRMLQFVTQAPQKRLCHVKATLPGSWVSYVRLARFSGVVRVWMLYGCKYQGPLLGWLRGSCVAARC